MNKEIVLSGVKPTGKVHIGNYFGAMKQFVDLQNQYQCFIFIADYHALTTVKNASLLKQNILEIAIDYLAIGLDPIKSIIFKQSDVPEVTELTWIFNCLTSISYLKRAHAFKDALAKKKTINMGLFDYPVLMAADILIYDADLVPVGQDQKQHIEMAIETANKFNHTYDNLFKIPKPLILKNNIVPGLDGRKMSKSYQNTIELFESDLDIKKKIMSIKTDSKDIKARKDPEKCNIFTLHKIFSEKIIEELKKRYLNGSIGYQESKEILIKNIIDKIAPLREKREDIKKDKNYVLGILEEGAKKAREKAKRKINLAKELIGVILK